MKIEWQVEDGYVAGRRPQETDLDDDDVRECETEDRVLERLNAQHEGLRRAGELLEDLGTLASASEPGWYKLVEQWRREYLREDGDA